MNVIQRNRSAAGIGALLSLCVACGPAVSNDTPTSDSSSSTTAASSPPVTSASPTSPNPTQPVTSTTDEPPLPTTTASGVTTDPVDDTGGCFLCPSDVGDPAACDLLMQDCPRGEKCSPWANDGGNSWNATKCVPIVDDPDAPGEPCTVEGSAVSGIDSCDGQSMCFNVNGETNTGECQAFCQGTAEEPTCEAGSICQISGEGVLALCLGTCDPTMPSTCDASEVCVPQYNTFVCAVATDLDGAFLDPCEFVNACDAGLVCIPPTSLDSCEGESGCCSPYCSLEQPECPDGTACLAYFDKGDAPKGLEHVGICVN